MHWIFIHSCNRAQKRETNLGKCQCCLLLPCLFDSSSTNYESGWVDFNRVMERFNKIQ